jgi:hypothetical protein
VKPPIAAACQGKEPLRQLKAERRGGEVPKADQFQARVAEALPELKR